MINILVRSILDLFLDVLSLIKCLSPRQWSIFHSYNKVYESSINQEDHNDFKETHEDNTGLKKNNPFDGLSLEDFIDSEGKATPREDGIHQSFSLQDLKYDWDMYERNSFYTGSLNELSAGEILQECMLQDHLQVGHQVLAEGLSNSNFKMFSSLCDTPIPSINRPTAEDLEILPETGTIELDDQFLSSFARQNLTLTDSGRKPRRRRKGYRSDGYSSYKEKSKIKPAKQRSYDSLLLLTGDRRFKPKERAFSAHPRLFSGPCPPRKSKNDDRNKELKTDKRSSPPSVLSKIPVRSPPSRFCCRTPEKTKEVPSPTKSSKGKPDPPYNEKAAFRSAANYLFERKFRVFATLGKKHGRGVTMSSVANELWLKQAEFLLDLKATVSANYIYRQFAGAKAVLTIAEYKEMMKQMCAMTGADYWEVLTRLAACNLPDEMVKI